MIVSDDCKWALYFKIIKIIVSELTFALASVINDDRKWRNNWERPLQSSFTMVVCLQYRPQVLLKTTMIFIAKLGGNETQPYLVEPNNLENFKINKIK